MPIRIISTPWRSAGSTGPTRGPQVARKDAVAVSVFSAPETFRCPADAGWNSPTMQVRPAAFESVGCSYRFNDYLQDNYQDRGVAEDPLYNLGLKKESWPPEPVRFVMMHEWAAYPWLGPNGPSLEVTQWHGSSSLGKASNPSQLAGKLIAPILFVDGHSQHCDFTGIIKRDPLNGLEAGKDWIWYNPKRR